MIELKRILAPTDFGDSSKSALRYAVAFADQFGAAVDLLHVVEPPPPGVLMSYVPLDDLKKTMLSEAEKNLEELHAEWAEYCFPVTKAVVEGYPFVEIVKYAREHNVDMIVLGTHGRGAVSHMLIGSVAEKVVRKAPCPVLTVRSPEHEFIHP